MTREEAIIKLQKQKAEYLEEWVDFSGIAEAYDMAIEALSIVRCKDCRHAQHREQMPNQIYCKRDKLSTFCAVHDDDDFCKYGEQLYTHEEVWADIEGRPQGEWSITDTDDGCGGESPHLICSVCKTEPLAWSSKRFFNFCPNCGADMRPLTGTERIKRIKGGEGNE